MTSMVGALNAALRRAMVDDSAVLVMGEDVGVLGGVFRVTDQLQAEFGNERCFDTPLAEAGFVGAAVGLAIGGFRPVVEIQFDGFVYPAFEQIVCHVAKYGMRTGVRLPIVIRIPYGGGIGAIEHHSESPETYFVHTAGLRVVTPSTPNDAYHLLLASIACPDPVIFLEPKHQYWVDGPVDETATIAQADLLGSASVIRAGTDLTLIAYGPTVHLALEAAEIAEREMETSIEVIDLRVLSPLDEATLVRSVGRTGRCIVVHEASRTLGLGAEIVARLHDRCFNELVAPIGRVTGYDTPYPPAGVEKTWLPTLDRVLDSVERALVRS